MTKRANRKPGRNQPCPCGSKIKYKKCCLMKPPEPIKLVEAKPRPKDSPQGRRNKTLIATLLAAAMADDGRVLVMTKSGIPPLLGKEYTDYEH